MKKLWSLLRGRRFRGLKVRRQHPVGPCTVDFYCHDLELVIEVDGSIHDDPARSAADTARQLELENEGLRVVRVSKADVLRQPDAALAAIELAMSVPHRLDRHVRSTAGPTTSVPHPVGLRRPPVPLPGGEGTI